MNDRVRMLLTIVFAGAVGWFGSELFDYFDTHTRLPDAILLPAWLAGCAVVGLALWFGGRLGRRSRGDRVKTTEQH